MGAETDAGRHVRAAAPAPAGVPPAADLSAVLQQQALRFLAVGAFTAVVDFASYRLLLAFDLPITPAKAIGFVIGTTLSYLLNRAWTFGAGQHAVARFLVLYAVTLVANVAVNAAAVAALADVAGRITIAWLVAQAVASALNFLGMRSYVFAGKSHG
jgi:putative flippase GtrA